MVPIFQIIHTNSTATNQNASWIFNTYGQTFLVVWTIMV